MFANLPDEILTHILTQIPVKTVLAFGNTSKRHALLIADTHFWALLAEKYLKFAPDKFIHEMKPGTLFPWQVKSPWSHYKELRKSQKDLLHGCYYIFQRGVLKGKRCGQKQIDGMFCSSHLKHRFMY